MALRKIVERVLPAPEPVDQQSFIDLLTDTPFFIPLRLFWSNLQELRPYWPILLPLLAIVGVRAYRNERRSLK